MAVVSFRFILSALAVIVATVAGCSSGSSESTNAPGQGAGSAPPAPPAGSTPTGSNPPGADGGGEAGSDAAGAPSDGGVDAAPPGCSDACAKAYACKLVSSPTGCVCGGKAGSAECATCWLSHTCDELAAAVCFSSCN